MGMFNFFGDNEHRVFNYKPVYYNPEDEERKRRFGRVDGSMDKKTGTDDEKAPYVPGSFVKGAFTDGNYKTSRSHTTRTQTIIGIITMLLIFAVLYMIARFYSSL